MNEEHTKEECCGSGCDDTKKDIDTQGGCCGGSCHGEDPTEDEKNELKNMKAQMEAEGGCCGGGCCASPEEEEEEEEASDAIDGSDEKKNVELFQVSQKAIIYDPEKKKYLLVQCVEEDPEIPALWAFVGGRIKEGENAIESLERKISEEAGNIEYDIEGTVSADIDGRCRVGYLVIYKGGEITLSKEHSRFVWKTFEETQTEAEFHQKIKKLIVSAHEKLHAQDALTGWKLCQADFENYKKSQMNLGQDFAARAVEDIMVRILPVLDNFHASTDHVPEDQKDGAWVTGIMHIQKQLEDTLKELGAEEIPVQVGDELDPEKHEAIQNMENGEQNTDNDEKERETNKESDGKIQKVVQKGYMFGGRVIRPARVIVS